MLWEGRVVAVGVAYSESNRVLQGIRAMYGGLVCIDVVVCRGTEPLYPRLRHEGSRVLTGLLHQDMNRFNTRSLQKSTPVDVYSRHLHVS